MKHFRILLPLLVLALLFSGCARETEPYTYTFDGKTIHIYPESGTIVDGLNVYRYTRTENPNGDIDYVISYPNGGRFNWTKTRKGGHGGGTGINENMYLPGDVLLAALEAGEPAKKMGSPILGLFLMAMGALHFFRPELAFRLEHLDKFWKFKHAEPSESYLSWLKISGVIIAAAGLLVCFV